MWNFLLSLFAGSTVGNTRTAQQFVRPVLAVFAIGVVIAGVIYACVVLRAVSERRNSSHVYSHSSH